MNLRGAAAILVSAAVLLTHANVIEAQMYKCVDAKGKMNYSDKPCPTGSKGAEVDIKGQAPISGKLQPQTLDPAREERDFQKRRIDAERQAKNEERERENRQRQCKSMHAELQRLGAQRRVASVNAQGERTFMDDKARDERIERLRTDIGRQCS